MRRLAALFLAMGISKHYLWPLFEASVQTSIWTMAGAATTALFLVLLTVIAVGQFELPRRVAQTLVLVAGWWLLEELMVFGCEVLYLLRPIFPIGDERCTAQVGVKVGSYGIFLVALLFLRFGTARNDRSQTATGEDNHGQ